MIFMTDRNKRKVDLSELKICSSVVFVSSAEGGPRSERESKYRGSLYTAHCG